MHEYYVSNKKKCFFFLFFVSLFEIPNRKPSNRPKSNIVFLFIFLFKKKHEPDETDNEFRTVVIAIELISQSGDHISHEFLFFYFCP